MDDVRLSARVGVMGVVGLVGLVGACDAATAASDKTSGLTPPAAWQLIPNIAKAAREGLGTTVTVEGAEAWGELSRGCYAVWLAVAGPGPADKIAENIVDGLTNPQPALPKSDKGSGSNAIAPLAVRDIAKPVGPEGTIALAFSRGAYSGRLAAKLGGGRIVALACFANQRQPAWCEPGCNALLGAIK